MKRCPKCHQHGPCVFTQDYGIQYDWGKRKGDLLNLTHKERRENT